MNPKIETFLVKVKFLAVLLSLKFLHQLFVMILNVRNLLTIVSKGLITMQIRSHCNSTCFTLHLIASVRFLLSVERGCCWVLRLQYITITGSNASFLPGCSAPNDMKQCVEQHCNNFNSTQSLALIYPYGTYSQQVSFPYPSSMEQSYKYFQYGF